MKRTILFIALALAAPAAVAAEARPQSAPPKNAAASAPAREAGASADAAAARAELSDLRAQMQDISRRMAKLSGELGELGPRAYAYRYLADPDRGMIGLVLAKDGPGLRVTAVTPGGPAERAGVRNGDVIVKVRGDFEGPSGDSAAFLNEALRNLKAGQEVKLSLRRDGKPLEITVKAERREPYNFAEALAPDVAALPPDFDQRIRESTERALREAQRAAGQARIGQEEARRVAERAFGQAQRALERAGLPMPWWGLNLASLNPELGRYFGTDKGALVISADAEALPGLRGGDVITRVAGEPVVRSEDALRALRDRPAGEDVPIELLRDRKPLALKVKAPAFKSIFPAPPAAPIPVPAPTPATAPPPPAPPVPSAPVAPAAPQAGA
jgi:S1-C subfamily serine protease